MEKEFDIQEYMTKGVERVVKDAIKAVFKDPRESKFMMQFSLASKRATDIRRKQEKEGLHVPPFLIASITSSCNLHCAGCYSRSNHATVDEKPVRQLTSQKWFAIFEEAHKLGISFILLAGGEPTMRRDIIQEAGKMQDILFPIFTNGIFLDERYMQLFDECRNLIPVLSIEGDRKITDERRGEGIYEKLTANMAEMQRRNLIFGISITVTRENLKEVTSMEYIRKMKARGCKLIIYVEFVPVTDEAKELTLTEEEQVYLHQMVDTNRTEENGIVIVSFPGDEKSSGGCIAAGRGFFHINSHGGAEPCPFSPYSDVNVKDTSLKEAMGSKLFHALQDGGILMDDHLGGCVLFEKKEMVEELLRGE